MDTAVPAPASSEKKGDAKKHKCPVCPPCHGWMKNTGAGTTARWRIGFIFGGILLMYGGLCGRLVHIQVGQNVSWKEKADKQSTIIERRAAARGEITDCNGLPLAFCHPKDTVIADLKLLATDETRVTAAKSLAPLLGMTVDAVTKKLGPVDPERRQRIVYLAREVDEDVATKVKALKIRGVAFEDAYTRVYPQGSLASNLLGWGRTDGGMEGIELELDTILKGTPGSQRYFRDAAKRLIASTSGAVGPSDTNPPRAGLSVALTIDARIQQTAEEELQRIHEQFDPKSASCIVMDCTTGAILAMACTPSFDPNDASDALPEHRRNRPITDIYEPGSTFKTFVAAMAIERKLAGRSTMFDCENGAWRIGYRTLHDSHAYGMLSFDDVISKSSNIGAAKIAQRLTLSGLYSTVQMFGFGVPTGINAPGEAKGRVRPRNVWTNDSLYSIAMGHEIGVTPIQIVSAFAAVVNGGVLYRPKLVQSVTNDQNEELYKLKPQAVRRVISPNTSKQMREILGRVVAPGGTGLKAFLAEWAVGGKTGTTKKIDPITKTYSSTLYIGSFCGFAPVENPRIVCLVTVDEPHKGSGYYGGTVACPAAKEVIRKALTVLNVPAKNADEQKKAIEDSRKLVLNGR